MPHTRVDANHRALRAIGRAARQARLAAGMRQHHLAEAIGVSRGTIANIERGSQNTTVGVLFILAMACGTSLDALVSDATKLWK